MCHGASHHGSRRLWSEALCGVICISVKRPRDTDSWNSKWSHYCGDISMYKISESEVVPQKTICAVGVRNT